MRRNPRSRLSTFRRLSRSRRAAERSAAENQGLRQEVAVEQSKVLSAAASARLLDLEGMSPLSTDETVRVRSLWITFGPLAAPS